MTTYNPRFMEKQRLMVEAGIIRVKRRDKAGMHGYDWERLVSDEEYNAWIEAYKDKQFETFSFSEWKSKLPKRIQDRFPAQIEYVDTNRTQTIPQMNYWMLTLPILVLAVVLIGVRK